MCHVHRRVKTADPQRFVHLLSEKVDHHMELRNHEYFCSSFDWGLLRVQDGDPGITKFYVRKR